MFEDDPDGATPLDTDEIDELLPTHLRTRGELNLWEQENVLEATVWSGSARATALDDATVRELHRRMFDKTWGWAGLYRSSGKTVGIDWRTIPQAIRNLIDDGRYWFKNGVFSIDEAALRLHHRLVEIHPFSNGNGRHGRLWCDMLLEQNGRPPFDWRNPELGSAGQAREAYISALQAADRGDYQTLFDLILRDR